MNPLTNSQLRIAVAEAMGWREAFPAKGKPHKETERGGILLPYKWVNERTHERSMELPNYPESLDACAGFEKTITSQQQVNYRNYLMLEASHAAGMGMRSREDDTLFCVTTSTARQRCLAFLRTTKPEMFL